MMKTPLSSAWLPSDLGFLYRAVDASRCKRLQESVEATFMGEAYAALDSDDLLYLKEQMEAEEDAERLLRRTEKWAFAAFKISFYVIERWRVLQQYLLKKVVEIKPKRKRTSSPSDGNRSTPATNDSASKSLKSESHQEKEQPETEREEKEWPLSRLNKAEGDISTENPVKSLLGVAYASSEDDED
uniref:Uncharacterized protein n=1 Tax=Quercus lobata TaxID=97700 RepID=A0A7N2RC13_QUELO